MLAEVDVSRFSLDEELDDDESDEAIADASEPEPDDDDALSVFRVCVESSAFRACSVIYMPS